MLPGLCAAISSSEKLPGFADVPELEKPPERIHVIPEKVFINPAEDLFVKT